MSGTARTFQRQNGEQNRHLEKILPAWISDVQWMSLSLCYCHLLKTWCISKRLEKASMQQGRDNSGIHRLIEKIRVKMQSKSQSWPVQLCPRLPEQHIRLGIKWSLQLSLFSLWLVQLSMFSLCLVHSVYDNWTAQLSRSQKIPLRSLVFPLFSSERQIEWSHGSWLWEFP